MIRIATLTSIRMILIRQVIGTSSKCVFQEHYRCFQPIPIHSIQNESSSRKMEYIKRMKSSRNTRFASYDEEFENMERMNDIKSNPALELYED